MVEKIPFAPMDELFAKSKTDEKHLQLLLAYCSAAFRCGSLFISCENDALFPDPKCMSEEEGADWKSITQYIVEEFKKLPIGEKYGVVKYKERLYLQRAFDAHQKVHEEFRRLSTALPAHTIDQSKARLLILRAVEEKLLLPEQGSAINSALTQAISFIFGGPGTGKTYTAGLFLKYFLLATSPQELSRLRIALVGPTGKATSNLENSIRKAVGETYNDLQIEAKTVHALLGKKRTISTDVSHAILPYHLIIVDETSMIDCELMKAFLERVQSGTRLLFLGDPDQLPPIEPGDIFPELIVKSNEKGLFSGKLTICVRTQLQEMVTLASLVKTGQSHAALDFLHTKREAVQFCPIAVDEEEKLLNSREDELLALFESQLLQENREMAFRILTPMKHGLLGVRELNKRFLARIQKKRQMRVPILITQNDYELGLMNGHMGILLDDTRAFFKEIGEIPSILLKQYEHAFAISVHKSQGSEFDKVILMLPPGSESFGRRMLYTAITRARTTLEIWALPETIYACIENRSVVSTR